LIFLWIHNNLISLIKQSESWGKSWEVC